MAEGVYLAGGGSARDEAAVWDAMLPGVSRLLYWPVALSGPLLDGAEAWLRTSLGDRPGLDVTTWLDLSEHRGEDLREYELVFVGGGNTFDLQKRLRTARMGPALRRFLNAGGAYYGGSAGAIVAGESIGLAEGLDEDAVHSRDRSGLRLVPGIDVLPHFTSARVERAERWSALHPERLVFGIPEASGVRFVDDRATILGPDQVDLYVDGQRAATYDADDTFDTDG